VKKKIVGAFRVTCGYLIVIQYACLVAVVLPVFFPLWLSLRLGVAIGLQRGSIEITVFSTISTLFFIVFLWRRFLRKTICFTRRIASFFELPLTESDLCDEENEKMRWKRKKIPIRYNALLIIAVVLGFIAIVVWSSIPIVSLLLDFIAFALVVIFHFGYAIKKREPTNEDSW